MTMQLWMADALRAGGLRVREVDGWRARGHGPMGTPVGVLGHHTAGPARGVFPSETVVVNGRTGLPGPLCNLGLDREGTWIVVAAGLAYHAGTGSLPWCPANQGNNYLIGIEAESTGLGDWTPAQLDSYPRGVAALLRYIGQPAARFAGHLEWAPTRKIDPAQWPGGMNGFRATVATYLAGGAPAAPAKQTTAPLEMIDMIVAQDASNGRLYLISGNCKLEFPSGGGDPKGPGKGNIYADILLDMIAKAYPDCPAPHLVALNPDVAKRIPEAWSFIDGSARSVPEPTPGATVQQA